jgi:hypothetical protein
VAEADDCRVAIIVDAGHTPGRLGGPASRRRPVAPALPKLAALMDGVEADVLAYKAFPAAHWPKLHSTNPIERLNKEVKRRADVVGIFPNEASIHQARRCQPHGAKRRMAAAAPIFIARDNRRIGRGRSHRAARRTDRSSLKESSNDRPSNHTALTDATHVLLVR